MTILTMVDLKYQKVLLILLIFPLWIQGQTNNRQDTLGKHVIVESLPKFPGGIEEMYKIIETNLEYPKSALKDKIGGKIITQFTIDTTGNITDIRIEEGVRDDIDHEIIRVLRLLNGWTPGVQKGKKVNVEYLFPITLYPNKKRKKKHKKDNK